MNKTAEEIAIDIYGIVGKVGGVPLCLACEKGRAILKVIEGAIDQGGREAKAEVAKGRQIWRPMPLPTQAQIEDTKERIRETQDRQEYRRPGGLVKVPIAPGVTAYRDCECSRNPPQFTDTTINAEAMLKNPTAVQAGTDRPGDTYCEECDIFGHVENSLVCYLWRNRA